MSNKLKQFLVSIELEKYVRIFEDNEIDYPDLLEIEEDELSEFVKNQSDVKTILENIKTFDSSSPKKTEEPPSRTSREELKIVLEKSKCTKYLPEFVTLGITDEHLFDLKNENNDSSKMKKIFPKKYHRKKFLRFLQNHLSDGEFTKKDLLDRSKKNFNEEAKKSLSLYILPRGSQGIDDKKDNFFDVIPKMESFLKDDTKKTMLLLGDAGAGKSLFGRYFQREEFRKIAKEIKLRKSDFKGRIPLFIRLTSVEDPTKFLLRNYFCDQLGLKKKEARYVVNNHPLLLILDGFDEINPKHRRNLYRLNMFGTLPNLKIIISCRTSALMQFKGERDFREFFAPVGENGYEFDKLSQIVIRPFNSSNRKEYIKKYVSQKKSSWGVSKYLSVISKEKLDSIFSNPFILFVGLGSLSLLSKSGGRITRFRMYEEFISKWLNREKGKVEHTNNKVIKTSSMWEFCRNIAIEMYKMKTNTFFFTVEIFDEHFELAKEDQDNDEEEWTYSFEEKKWIKFFINLKKKYNSEEIKDLLNCCPVRKMGTSRYQFLHKSFWEFIIASTIVKDIRDHKKVDKMIASLAINHLNRERSILFFICDVFERKCLVDEYGNDYTKLLSIICHSQTYSDSHVIIASANSATILNYCHFVFQKLPLSGIDISGADMNGMVAFGCDFSGSSFCSVDLRNAKLQDCKFNSCDMTNIRLDLPLTLFSSSGKLKLYLSRCGTSCYYFKEKKGKYSLYRYNLRRKEEKIITSFLFGDPFLILHPTKNDIFGVRDYDTKICYIIRYDGDDGEILRMVYEKDEPELDFVFDSEWIKKIKSKFKDYHYRRVNVCALYDEHFEAIAYRVKKNETKVVIRKRIFLTNENKEAIKTSESNLKSWTVDIPVSSKLSLYHYLSTGLIFLCFTYKGGDVWIWKEKGQKKVRTIRNLFPVRFDYGSGNWLISWNPVKMELCFYYTSNGRSYIYCIEKLLSPNETITPIHLKKEQGVMKYDKNGNLFLICNYPNFAIQFYDKGLINKMGSGDGDGDGKTLKRLPRAICEYEMERYGSWNRYRNSQIFLLDERYSICVKEGDFVSDDESENDEPNLEIVVWLCDRTTMKKALVPFLGRSWWTFENEGNNYLLLGDAIEIENGKKKLKENLNERNLYRVFNLDEIFKGKTKFTDNPIIKFKAGRSIQFLKKEKIILCQYEKLFLKFRFEGKDKMNVEKLKCHVDHLQKLSSIKYLTKAGKNHKFRSPVSDKYLLGGLEHPKYVLLRKKKGNVFGYEYIIPFDSKYFIQSSWDFVTDDMKFYIFSYRDLKWKVPFEFDDFFKEMICIGSSHKPTFKCSQSVFEQCKLHEEDKLLFEEYSGNKINKYSVIDRSDRRMKNEDGKKWDEEVGKKIPRNQGRTKFAFIIGNSKYKHFKPLPNAKRDALIMCNVLDEFTSDLGFNTMEAIDLDGDDLIDRFDTFVLNIQQKIPKNLTSEITIVVFYAGHGFIFEKDADECILPIDCKSDIFKKKPSDVWGSCLGLKQIMNSLSQVPRASKIIFFDACREIKKSEFVDKEKIEQLKKQLEERNQSKKKKYESDSEEEEEEEEENLDEEKKFVNKKFKEVEMKREKKMFKMNSGSKELIQRYIISYSTEKSQFAFEGGDSFSHYTSTLASLLKKKTITLGKIIDELEKEVKDLSNGNQIPNSQTDSLYHFAMMKWPPKKNEWEIEKTKEKRVAKRNWEIVKMKGKEILKKKLKKEDV